MKWIAVDYGERRTGLAVCDASELIVTPVTPQIEEKSLNKVAEAAAAARLAQGLRALCAACPQHGRHRGFPLRKKPPLCRAACHCLRGTRCAVG